MGGMKSLFTKIIPIIMLVCFICLGITHTFGRFDAETGQSNITYLSKDTIQTGTQEHPYELTYYDLDVNGYMNGMNNNFIQRSLENVIDIDAYSTTLNNFNRIWENGYQLFDITKTIGNAILLVINTIILPINIILVPLRIISGIILTAFSLVGINTSRESVIIDSLNGIIDHAAIPFLNILINSQEDSLNNEMYRFNADLSRSLLYELNNYPTEFNVSFKTAYNDQTFIKIKINANEIGNNKQMYYIYQENGQNTEILVYQNGWIVDENYKYIQIQEYTGNTDYVRFSHWLNANASQIFEFPVSQYYNQTYTWQDTTLQNFNVSYQVYINVEIESNSTTYNILGFACDTSSTAIVYFIDNNNYSIAYDSTNNGWTDNAYKTFTIKQEIINNSQEQFINRLLELNLIA